jgi:hypothetical protein
MTKLDGPAVTLLRYQRSSSGSSVRMASPLTVTPRCWAIPRAWGMRMAISSRGGVSLPSPDTSTTWRGASNRL